MRKHVFVPAMAALLISTLVHGQQPQHDPATTEPEVVPVSSQTNRTAPTTRDVQARKSLMGMVMGALIESAEQTAREKRNRITRMESGTSVPPEALAPADRPPRAQVAVQSEP